MSVSLVNNFTVILGSLLTFRAEARVSSACRIIRPWLHLCQNKRNKYSFCLPYEFHVKPSSRLLCHLSLLMNTTVYLHYNSWNKRCPKVPHSLQYINRKSKFKCYNTVTYYKKWMNENWNLIVCFKTFENIPRILFHSLDLAIGKSNASLERLTILSYNNVYIIFPILRF